MNENNDIEYKDGKIDKVKCSICGEKYPIYDMFCLTSCRGASSLCIKSGCVIVCQKCLIRIKKCLDNLDWSDVDFGEEK